MIFDFVSFLRRLEHYSQMSDVQSLAMLCSVFRGHGSPQEYFTLYGHQQPRAANFTPHHSRYVCLETIYQCLNSVGINCVLQLKLASVVYFFLKCVGSIPVYQRGCFQLNICDLHLCLYVCFCVINAPLAQFHL